jgi:Zn-dependent peptidase ImmA (M78 family)
MAAETLATFKVGRPPVPIELLCHDLMLVVVHDELPYETSSLLIQQPNGRLVLGVNARHSARRQRFSLAHELGHALLHNQSLEQPDDGEAFVSRPLQVLFRDGLAGQGTDRVEIDANVFAAALLMPANMIRESFGRVLKETPNRTLDDLVGDLADEYDVSDQAMSFRLVNLGLMDPA